MTSACHNMNWFFLCSIHIAVPLFTLQFETHDSFCLFCFVLKLQNLSFLPAFCFESVLLWVRVEISRDSMETISRSNSYFISRATDFGLVRLKREISYEWDQFISISIWLLHYYVTKRNISYQFLNYSCT